MTEGKSMLDAMASGLMEKSASPVPAARPLTPVGGEVRASGPIPSVAKLPNDTGIYMSNESMEMAARNLRKYAGELIAIADGLDALTGESSLPEVAADPAAEQKAKESAADAKHAAVKAAMDMEAFPDRFARLRNEAEAATFSPVVETVLPEVPVENVDGWLCPEHLKSVARVSPKGRKFKGCPVEGCKEFEKG